MEWEWLLFQEVQKCVALRERWILVRSWVSSLPGKDTVISAGKHELTVGSTTWPVLMVSAALVTSLP